jgi:hypothetical protein
MVFSLRSVGCCAGLAACSLAFALSGFGQASNPASKGAQAQSLLPSKFSRWTAAGAATTGTAPALADAANADVLSEYGLKDFAASAYREGSNRVSVRAMRFADATGAYGAFTYYRKPGMKPETIGSGGAADAHEVIFRSGVIVVEATFDHGTVGDEAALKTLASQLPPAGGADAVPPSLPQYLPASDLDASTVRYAIGPIAYTRMGGVLPVALIDFSRDAEAVTAQYPHGDGIGTLTILEYPTPQMARERAKAIDAMIKAPLPPALQQGNPSALAVKLSGPLVAVTSGNMSFEEAQNLIAGVKYQADVTWNRPGNSKNEVKNAAEMLLGIAYLTAILGVAALLLGGFLGGGRALWRVMHGKPVSTVYEEDFISLNLNSWTPESPRKMP